MTIPLQVLTPAQHRFLGELYAARGQRVLDTTHDPEAAHLEAASLCAWFVRAWADGTLEPAVVRTPTGAVERAREREWRQEALI
jgi:hypothetical protein